MTTADAVPTPEGAPRHRRRRGTFADMLRSLGLVALMLLALMFYARLGTPSHPAASTDASAIVTAARSESPFPVLVATGLPKGWYVNAASFDAVPGATGLWRFHVGYSDGAAGYLGIDASNATDAQRTLTPAPGSTPERHATAGGLAFSVFSAASTGSGREAWIAQGVGRDGNPYVIRIERTSGARTAVLASAAASPQVSTGSSA